MKRQRVRPAAWLAAALAAGMTVGTPPAAAQTPGLGASGGVAYEAYVFGDAGSTGIRNLSLLTLPLGAQLRFGPSVSLDVAGAYARGTLERADGGTSEVSGLTDTQLRLGFRFGSGASTGFDAIVVLPTGNATHTLDEALVAGAIAADLLPFRISHWGAGGAAGLGTTWRGTSGATGYGVSASYLIGREFEPLDGQQVAYRPGDQLRVRATLDHLVGAASKLTVTAGAEHHRHDALDGSNLYRAGNRFNVVGSYSFAARPRGAGIAYAGAFHRTRGTALLDWAREASAQTLLVAGAGLRLPVGWGVLVPSADGRLLRSQDGIGQGHVFAAGLLTELRAGDVVLVPGVRGRFGRIVVREGSESGLTGFELGLTARFGERRP